MTPFNDHKKDRIGFFILTVFIGIICVLPQIFYQPFILQGDHGRDLYIFQQTANGAIPYIDYPTSNGPLMPYYYALFLSLLGHNIQNVLIGYAVLIFLAGIFLYLIAREGMTRITALLCACWYWAWRGEEFFYTYNHIGAFVTGLTVILLAIQFLKNPTKHHIIWGSFFSLMTILIRPNIGLATLVGFFLTTFLIAPQNNAHRKKFLKTFLLPTSIILAGVVFLLIFVLPDIFGPYWSSIEWRNILSNIRLIGKIWFQLLAQNFLLICISITFGVLSLTGLFHLIKTHRQEASRLICQMVLTFLIFFSLFFMEFLLGSRFFRWVWVMPIILLIIFYLLHQGLNILHRYGRGVFYTITFGICALLILSQYATIAVSHNNAARLDIGETHLYLSSDQRPWIDTVTQTATFIHDNTHPNEPILTIPYDALYCFLTNHPLAVSNPSLIGVSGENIIKEIEKKHIRLIIISNRAFSHHEEDRFGIFGKNYGAVLWEYIQKHYTETAQFGPWQERATPVYNHAVKIYLRKTPFPIKNTQIRP